MTDKKRQLPDKIVDADGRPTLDFIAWADDLIYGTAADSIGTLLSGRNADSAKITGIIAGRWQRYGAAGSAGRDIQCFCNTDWRGWRPDGLCRSVRCRRHARRSRYGHQ